MRIISIVTVLGVVYGASAWAAPCTDLANIRANVEAACPCASQSSAGAYKSCVKGALKWETEMGVKIMHPGDMLFIPKGIGHRSMLCEDSTDDNVLIELKIADDLTYVGEDRK